MLLASSLAMVLGLALPAFLVTAAMSGKAGVRDLLSRSLRWRVVLAVQAMVIVLFRVAIMWLYNSSGRSALVVAPGQPRGDRHRPRRPRSLQRGCDATHLLQPARHLAQRRSRRGSRRGVRGRVGRLARPHVSMG